MTSITGPLETLRKWYECESAEADWYFHDRISAAIWLRRFRPDELRRIANEVDEGPTWARATDEKIIERLAGLIVSGFLRVTRADGERSAEPAARGRDLAPEAKIIRRLRVTNKEFTFQTNRLRIVTAQDWWPLREKSAGRYQIVPREDARELLMKIAEWPAISPEEKGALQEAVPLLPDTRRTQFFKGILLLRSVARASVRERSIEAPPVTPSQLAGSRQKEKLHWVEIELIDADDKPVANEPYRLQLPDGSIRTGTLDAKGCAYIGDIATPGQCKVCFPEIDAHEWRPA
jgi:hypothetical protein